MPKRPLTNKRGEVRPLTAEDFEHFRPISEVDPGMIEAAERLEPQTWWRYQPVYRDDPGGRAVTLCEVYINAAGALECWTENPAMHPQGETVAELANDLRAMLSDALMWEPIAFDDLHAGMTFEAVPRPMSAEVEVTPAMIRAALEMACRLPPHVDARQSYRAIYVAMERARRCQPDVGNGRKASKGATECAP